MRKIQIDKTEGIINTPVKNEMNYYNYKASCIEENEGQVLELACQHAALAIEAFVANLFFEYSPLNLVPAKDILKEAYSIKMQYGTKTFFSEMLSESK